MQIYAKYNVNVNIAYFVYYGKTLVVRVPCDGMLDFENTQTWWKAEQYIREKV